MKRAGPTSLVLTVLLSMVVLGVWGSSASKRAQNAQREARRQMAAALVLQDQPGQRSDLLRAASSFHAGYRHCEQGIHQESQGRLAEAAESFRACWESDPDLVAAHLAWAHARVRAGGRPPDFQEVRIHLRRLCDPSRRHPAQSPAACSEVGDLIRDLEILLADNLPPDRLAQWTSPEIRDVLLRPNLRGASRYDGPRVPLHLRFRPGDTTLGAEAEELLRKVAIALRDGLLASATIQIEGHTDSIEGGSEGQRRALARRRAEVVRDFLVRQSVPAGRLRTAAFGADYPLAPNQDTEDRGRNRRVELVNLETQAP
ncbi:MAG TPA: OmpA family protein, partial [Thermoanaerobaculia bacterium]|nr:OmpA family protein [Thermoanaerobaculia bacterium]